MKFTGNFFEARKAICVDNGVKDPLDKWIAMCQNIQSLDKFSQRYDQNIFEKSVIASCLDRLSRHRPLSSAQKDLVSKMFGRKGPVAFCGHRH